MALLFTTAHSVHTTFVCTNRFRSENTQSFGKFNISAAMCMTGNKKTGKSRKHHFSGNKSPGKYTRYTVFISVMDLVFCDFSQSEAEVADFDRAYRPHPPLARS